MGFLYLWNSFNAFIILFILFYNGLRVLWLHNLLLLLLANTFHFPDHGMVLVGVGIDTPGQLLHGEPLFQHDPNNFHYPCTVRPPNKLEPLYNRCIMTFLTCLENIVGVLIVTLAGWFEGTELEHSHPQREYIRFPKQLFRRIRGLFTQLHY